MSTVDAHARLEQSYRRMLWLFPPSYRAARGHEVVDVLMERADPGQHRPSRGEVVALLRFGVRTWTWRTISPSRRAGQDGLGILAVLLPIMLLFPAAAALHVWADISALSGSFRLDSLPFGVDVPAWLLWGVTAVLVVAGRSSWPRYSAILGVVAYAVAIIVQYEDDNFLVVGNSVGLLAVQVVAAVALSSPQWLDRGRQRIPVWCAAVLGAVTAVLGFLLSTTQYRPPFINSAVLFPVTAVLAAAFGVAALFTAAGRALLPIVAALAGLILVAKYRAESHPWANGQPATTGAWSHISAGDVLVLIAAPVAVFIIVRTITAAVNTFSRTNPPQRAPIAP